MKKVFFLILFTSLLSIPLAAQSTDAAGSSVSAAQTALADDADHGSQLAPQPLDPSALCPRCGSYSTHRWCAGYKRSVAGIHFVLLIFPCLTSTNYYYTNFACYACGYTSQSEHPHNIMHYYQGCPSYPIVRTCPYT